MKNIEQNAAETVNKMLIGNKADRTDARVISTERGQALADEYGIAFTETSAKSAENVEESFVAVARAITARLANSEAAAPAVGGLDVGSQGGDDSGGKKKGCC